MTWTVSLHQLAFVIIVLGVSCILIARRRRETREELSITPGSRGGAPMWVWIIFAVWATLSLAVGIALLLTGHAVFDY